MSSTSCLEMVSPRPLPREASVSPVRICRNGSNTFAARCAGTPLPVSSTSNVMLSCHGAARSTTRPACVYLTAFERRLMRTRITFSRSSTAVSGRSEAISVSRVRPFARACGSSKSDVSARSGRRGACCGWRSRCPASSFARSRMLLIIRRSVSALSRMTWMSCSRRSSSVGVWPSRSIRWESRMIVFSGVRSSCETVERKSDFSRSSSTSFSYASERSRAARPWDRIARPTRIKDRARASSSVGSSGLAMKSSAPAAKPFSRSISPAVTSSTGRYSPERDTSSAARSYPDSSPSITSTIARSNGRSSCATDEASSSVPATTTSCPSLSRSARMIRATSS